jgi:CheY-like chemotaxis protein
MGLILLSCVGILTAEYRLSVPSLVSTIPAMLFAGIATALGRAAVQCHLDDAPSRRIEQLYFLSAGYVIGGIWTFLSWPDRYLLQAELRHVPIPLPLLAIHVIATAAALRTGGSTIFPVAEHPLEDRLDDDDTKPTGDKDAHTLLVLVGLTSCYAALSVRRSYTNWVQYCCFAIAVLCIVYTSMLISKHSGIALPQDDHTVYELLDNSASTETGEEESNETDDIESAQQNLQRQSIRLPVGPRAIFHIVVVLLLCILSTVMNYSTFEYSSDITSLDRDYTPAASLEVVISIYKEPVGDVWDFIARLKSAPQTSKASVIVYSKDEEADAENLKLRTGADKVIMLPNIGREGETYLHRINTRWDTLAKHTIFLQADVQFS